MRTTLFLSLLVAAAALAACGGGGSSASAPAAKPTNTSDRPASAGDAFAYTGLLTQSSDRTALEFPPTPSPNPANVQTLTSTVTQAIAVTANATFNGIADAYDFRTSESDTENGGLKTSTSVTDTYYDYEKSGSSTRIVELGSTETTSDGVSYKTVYGSGNGLVDVLPEKAGVLAPANNAAATSTETDPDGEVTTRDVNADGSYTETIDYPDGTSGTAVAAADGSGSYSFPLTTSAFPNSTITVGAPTPGPSNIPAIAIKITIPNAPAAAATPTPSVLAGFVPVWYPTPVALFTQTLVDEGAAAVPSQCSAAAFSGTASQVVTVTTTVDPVFGDTDQQTTATYSEPGVGVACIQLTDLSTQYYDFSGQGQNGAIPIVGSSPVQTTTIAETLGLASETVVGTSSIARSPAARALFFAAGLDNFRALVARRANARHAAFLRALRGKR